LLYGQLIQFIPYIYEDPPNSAATVIAQIVIIPIGMMALVIGAGLRTMLNI
jgi:hypothetical protein